jgi:hypothetical protein
LAIDFMETNKKQVRSGGGSFGKLIVKKIKEARNHGANNHSDENRQQEKPQFATTTASCRALE